MSKKAKQQTSTFNLEKLSTVQMQKHLDFTIQMGLDRFNKDKQFRKEIQVFEYKIINDEIKLFSLAEKLDKKEKLTADEKKFYEEMTDSYKTLAISTMNSRNHFGNFESMSQDDHVLRRKDLEEERSLIERKLSKQDLKTLRDQANKLGEMSRNSFIARYKELKGSINDRKKDINIAFFGRRGTGKTVITKNQIKQSGCKGVLLNLSTFERPDLTGYAKVFGNDKYERFVDFYQPEFFREMMDGDEPVVLILDEADKADSSVLAPLLEITQFRTINGRPLPNLIACVITGNLLSEGGNKPAPPLLDRCEKYLCQANADEWIEWAANEGKIHPAIVALVSDKKSVLIGDDDMDENYADASPRGFERASEICYLGERLNQDNVLIQEKVSGCLGFSVGTQFRVYHEHFAELTPIVNKVMKGEGNLADVANFAQTKKYVLLTSISNRLATMIDDKKTSKEDLKVLDNGANFMLEMSAKDSDIVFSIIRTVIGQKRLYGSNKTVLIHSMEKTAPFYKLINSVKTKAKKIDEMTMM